MNNIELLQFLDKLIKLLDMLIINILEDNELFDIMTEVKKSLIQ